MEQTPADDDYRLPQNIFEHMKFKSQPAPPAPPTPAPAVKPTPVVMAPPTTASRVPPSLEAPIAAIGKRKLEGRPTAESLNSASAANSSKQNGHPLPARSVSSTNPHNLLARLSIASPTTPSPPGASDGQIPADKSTSDRPLKRQKTVDQTGHSLLARIGSSSELGTSKPEPVKATPARQIKVQSSSTTSRTPTAVLPQAAANAGPGGTPQDKLAIDLKTELSSDRAEVTPKSPTSAMSIKGAAAKVSPPRSGLPAQSGQTQGMLAIAGAANAAATTKRPGTGQTHGTVSFQRALASINQPTSSLDSLRPLAQQPKEVAKPVELRLPAKPAAPKVASPLPATTSLLQRFTNGGQPRATATVARGSLSLSERLQTAPGDMDVDEPSLGGGNHGHRKRRGRK